MTHQKILAPLILLSSVTTSVHAFQPPSSRPTRKKTMTSTPLHYVTSTGTPNNAVDNNIYAPAWVPMELVELAAEDLSLTTSEFASQYADIEAYTSCDDEGDDLHECDFFGQYLGPTKWLHLTPEARTSAINQVHFAIWKEVLSHPHSMVDAADKVSKETLRHFEEFVLEPRTNASSSPSNQGGNIPNIKVKVVPASFGLEGFEDAVWEACEYILENYGDDESTTASKAITFVVAAPDINDPILTDRSNDGTKSPQAEFDADGFEEFANGLLSKMQLFSNLEGEDEIDLLEDRVILTSFHPQWRQVDESGSKSGTLEDRLRACRPFPYPCVALCADQHS